MSFPRIVRRGSFVMSMLFAAAAGAADETAKNAAGAAETKTSTAVPESYTVKLETTKGDILIDVTRKSAPLGADRFYELVKSGYYDDTAFFRVISGFMAQIGISGSPAKNLEWRAKKIKDDPVVESNSRGMISFAMAGPNTRTTQIFINLVDNKRLDTMGFAPFGKVRDMGTVDKLCSEYGEGAPRGKGPDQGEIMAKGNEYLKKSFPQLDYIKKATIMEAGK